MLMYERKCDIHVLRLNEPFEWFQKCYGSLPHDVADVHVLPGIEGEIGQARLNGYMIGSHPYVMSADPDDVYVPSTIRNLIKLLDNNPKLGIAYSGEFRWDADTGSKKHMYKPFKKRSFHKTPTMIHGAQVFRREAIAPFLQYLPAFKRRYETWFLQAAVIFNGWEVCGTSVVGRQWRNHPNQTSRIRVDSDSVAIQNYLYDGVLP